MANFIYPAFYEKLNEALAGLQNDIMRERIPEQIAHIASYAETSTHPFAMIFPLPPRELVARVIFEHMRSQGPSRPVYYHRALAWAFSMHATFRYAVGYDRDRFFSNLYEDDRYWETGER